MVYTLGRPCHHRVLWGDGVQNVVSKVGRHGG